MSGDGIGSGPKGSSPWGLRGFVRRTVAYIVPRGRFSRGVVVLVGGTTVSQVIFVVSAPLLTRLYSPTDFGVLSVYGSSVTLLGVIVGLRYMQAVPVSADEKEAANVAALSILLGGVMAAAVGLLGVAFSYPLTTLLGVPELAPYMWLLPFSLFGGCLYQTLYLWAIREQGFAVMARTRITQAVARVGVQLTLGVAGVAPLGLLLGELVGGAAGSGGFARLIGRRRPGILRSISRRALKAVARRYRRFAFLGTPAGLLNVAGLQGIPLLVAYSYGATVAGWYALAMRAVALPMSVVGAAVGETFFGVAAELARTNPAELLVLFRKAAVRLLLIGIGPTLVLMILGPSLFSFVFGEQWETAGVYARYLAPAILAQLVVSPLSQTTTILERQGLQLSLDAFRVTMVLGTVLLADTLSWEAKVAIIVLSAALLVSYVVYYVSCWLAIRKRVADHRQEQRSAEQS